MCDYDEPGAAPAGNDLEDVSRRRLAECERSFQQAAAALEQVLREGLHDTDPLTAAAREHKAAARAVYLTELRRFTDLVLRGKSPEG